MPPELHQKLKNHPLYTSFKITCSCFLECLSGKAFPSFFSLYPGKKKLTSDPQRYLSIIYLVMIKSLNLWVLVSLFEKQRLTFSNGTIISEAETLARCKIKLLVQATHISKYDCD